MELPGKVHQETSKTSEAENSLIKQSADGLDSSEGKGRSSAIKVSEDQDEYAAALEQENRKETAEPEKATFPDSLGESRDETDVRRQSTHDWWDLEVDWEDFEVDGEDPSGTASKASAKDTTEPSMTTHMASKNEGESEPAEQTPGPEQATGSESGLLPVEAQTLMQSEVEAFCAHLTRLWPEVSATDAFVHFAGRGSDTLFAGTFTSVANSVGLPVDIFPLLSGDKSYVHLEDWLGFLEGAVQMVPEAPAAPAHQREEEFEQRVRDLLESLEEEEDTSTESTGAANTDSAVQGSEDEPSSPEEVSVQDDHSLTQRNDLKALVQELQAQLNKSEEEKIRWQREAQRQEEAATELREEMMRLMQGRTTGTCSEDLRLGARRRQWPHQRGVGSGPTIKDYKVGEQVQAVFPGDGYWYSAVVTKIGGTFTVKWDDPYGGPEESEVDAKDMKYPRIPFDKLELGQKYHGTVKSVLDFGAIVDIGAQSHGLLHISCICKERIENIYDILSEGQQVDVWISGKREDEGKYGLTMVGLSDRRRRPPADLKPFADLPSDEWFNGVVARIVPFGAFVTVTLEDGPSADGLLHVSKIKDGFVDKVENYVSTGQDVQVRIESVDLDSNKMNLSMRGSRMIQDPRVQQWWYSFTRPIA